MGCTRTNHRVVFKSLMRPNLCCNYVAQHCVTFLHCAAVQRFAGFSKAMKPWMRWLLIQKCTLPSPICKLRQAPAPPHQDPYKEKKQSRCKCEYRTTSHISSRYMIYMLAPPKQKLRKCIARLEIYFEMQCWIWSVLMHMLCVIFT